MKKLKYKFLMSRKNKNLKIYWLKFKIWYTVSSIYLDLVYSVYTELLCITYIIKNL